MADVVGQAEEKERRLNKSRKKLERKLVGHRSAFSGHPPSHRPPPRPSSSTPLLNVATGKPTCRLPSFECELPRGPGLPKRSPANTHRTFFVLWCCRMAKCRWRPARRSKISRWSTRRRGRSSSTPFGTRTRSCSCGNRFAARCSSGTHLCGHTVGVSRDE